MDPCCPTPDLKSALLTWGCQWGVDHWWLSLYFFCRFHDILPQWRVRRYHEIMRCFLHMIPDQEIVTVAYAFKFVCEQKVTTSLPTWVKAGKREVEVKGHETKGTGELDGELRKLHMYPLSCSVSTWLGFCVLSWHLQLHPLHINKP